MIGGHSGSVHVYSGTTLTHHLTGLSHLDSPCHPLSLSSPPNHIAKLFLEWKVATTVAGHHAQPHSPIDDLENEFKLQRYPPMSIKPRAILNKGTSGQPEDNYLRETKRKRGFLNRFFGVTTLLFFNFSSLVTTKLLIHPYSCVSLNYCF